jgi:hypothetical protein
MLEGISTTFDKSSELSQPLPQGRGVLMQEEWKKPRL